MSPNPYGISRLPYPINRRTLLEQDDLFPFVSGNPEDSDDCSWFVIQLSNENRLKFTSALLAGMDLIYPDEFVSLMQLWLQPTEFPNTFPPASIGCDPVDLCQLMIECIETTPELRDLIQSVVDGMPDAGGQESRIQSTVFADGTCNNDVLYGYSKALWQYINASSIDALQIISEATNASEQLSKLITAVIPGMELLPVDEVLGWIESFGNYNLEAYEASITVGLEEQIICDLFCLSVENGCTLDFDTVYEYFIDKMGGVSIPTATATLSEWVYFMVVGSYPTDRIVYMWSAFQLGLAFMGYKFLGLSTVERYSLIAQTGDPDNDWELLCDDCGWVYESDFPTSQEGWDIIDSGYGDDGTWVITDGFESADVRIGVSTWCRIIYIEQTIVSTAINTVTVNYDMLKGTWIGAGGSTIAVIATKSDTTTVIKEILYTATVNGANQDFVADINEPDIVNIKVLARCSRTAAAAYSGGVDLNSLIIEGTGDNPFI